MRSFEQLCRILIFILKAAHKKKGENFFVSHKKNFDISIFSRFSRRFFFSKSASEKSFRINRIEAPIVKPDGDCAESLTIYDADYPDPARVIKTFCDTFSKPMEKVDFVSTGRSMFVKFVSRTGSYSGSSLYYWGHYDFFNNTKFGSGVPNTLCDEVFYAWEHPHGILRSPLNTLIYKRIASTSDVRCQYKFVNDKRAFARVVIEMISISFKEIPYSVSPCTRCHEERVDKLIIWEEKNKTQHRFACFCDNIPRPVRIISSDAQMNLEMLVLGQYATQHYFKYPNTLFTANYEFVHPPLCGPSIMGPKADGELIFPHKNSFGLPITGAPQKVVKCIWELKVASQRDLWLSVDKAKFGIYGSCEVGKIEVYLAGRLEPRFVVCPENASLAKDLPILSAAELGALDNGNDDPLPVIIQYTGDNRFPGKSAFRMVWTELFHLPRNPDGTLSTAAQMLKSPCDFVCPGNPSICLPRHLICNGIVNCPNASKTNNEIHSMETLITNVEETLQTYGIFNLKNVHLLNDESPELCRKTEHDSDYYDEYENVKWALIVAGSCFVVVMFLAVLWKMCKGRTKNQ